ncbi:SEC-C metal-binding domain-containing protein [Candidatus Accumulibacter aalborgensis]|uniref:SEC-C metal-binding domain-containing protein n=1 Tax=Candidatus Accumulibacter aalborgensis TaxID=1860102 RepID=UPI001FE07A4D|nr:SEC-C metal-binding domain-containing protein [Candidatus Accumulibacter aalborgensis]
MLTRGLRVREAWQAGHGYVAAAAAIEGLTSFMLNIDAVTPADLHGQALAATDVEPRIAAIVDRLQGDVLDDIARLWVLGKGYPDQREVVLAAKTIEVSAWQPGDMVAYRDVFNWVRRDRYLFDGDPGVFEAFDGYCINPACDCGDVVVQFYQLATAGDPQPVGEVAVNLSGRIEFIPEPGHDATLDRLWAAYGKRHPAYLACLAQRNADMKCIGKKRESLHRPKIGRNEPCPCGSGKKYKRCCADAIPD